MKQQFTIGTNGIVFEDNSVLLILRNDYDEWVLPGGALESREILEEGVMREVLEETGYGVRVKRLVGIYEKPEKHDIVFLFECEITSGETRLNREARDIKFFPIDKLPENITANMRERIRDARGTKGIVCKVQIPTDRTRISKLK